MQDIDLDLCYRWWLFSDEGYLYKRVVHGSDDCCADIVYKKVCVNKSN